MQILDQLSTSTQLTPDQKEKAAKQMGFNNYAEMIAFERQRSTKRESSTVAKQGGVDQTKKPAPQTRKGALDFLGYIQETFNKALK